MSKAVPPTHSHFPSPCWVSVFLSTFHYWQFLCLVICVDSEHPFVIRLPQIGHELLGSNCWFNFSFPAPGSDVQLAQDGAPWSLCWPKECSERWSYFPKMTQLGLGLMPGNSYHPPAIPGTTHHTWSMFLGPQMETPKSRAGTHPQPPARSQVPFGTDLLPLIPAQPSAQAQWALLVWLLELTSLYVRQGKIWQHPFNCQETPGLGWGMRHCRGLPQLAQAPSVCLPGPKTVSELGGGEESTPYQFISPSFSTQSSPNP